MHHPKSIYLYLHTKDHPVPRTVSKSDLQPFTASFEKPMNHQVEIL